MKLCENGCFPTGKIYLQIKYIRFANIFYSLAYTSYVFNNILLYNIENKKMILHNVTGTFDPKKVTVIIGPSGAGKTTLLKIISGEQFLNVQGTIIVNGVEQNKRSFRKQVCYVPQQFALLPFLTGKETLYIAARLKLKADQSNQAIYLIVSTNILRKCALYVWIL